MNGKRHEFDQVGFGTVYLFDRDGQRPAFFQEQLGQILESAGNHETCIGKIEALRHCSREIERFSNHDLTGR